MSFHVRGRSHRSLLLGRALRGSLAAACFVCAAQVALAAERQVLLVAAVDGYADLKSQLGWFGKQIENPGLTAMVESLIMLSTQGRGLAGLDVKRPLGIVVTSDGTDVAAHGFVPVKDLDKLLAALQGVTGPVKKDGDSRSVTLPSGIRLVITERDGWALVAPAGLRPPADDPTSLLAAVAKDYTLGIEAFPGRMSDDVRRRFEELVERQAAESAAQGQIVDRDSVAALLASLRQTESLTLGFAIDEATGAVFVENRSVALPGSVSAAASATAGKGSLTVGMPPLADGERPAIRGYVAQAIPEEARAQFLQTLDQLLPREAEDPLRRTVSRLAYDMLSATLAAGSLEAALAVDTTAATKDRPVPAVTAGVRVKDGKALEQRVKNAFGAAGGALPGVKARFDTGKAGAATLHTVSFEVADEDLADRIGKSLDLTLAVAPDYALVLTGGDAKQRAEAALAASGRPVADAQPIAGLQVTAAPLLDYIDAVTEEGQAARAATTAREAGGGVAEVRVRPVERGVATRLSIDAGVLKAVAAMTTPEKSVGPGGIPLPEVPPGFPIPVPAPR